MKAHLVASDDPLREGLTYHAVCGTRVQDAIFEYFFTEDVPSFREALSTINTCSKCLEAQIFLEGRYVYGLVSAKKLPTSERCEEVAIA